MPHRHAARQLTVPIDTLDHVLGEASEPLVVVQYGDFSSADCAAAHAAMAGLRKRLDKRFRLVFRHFPDTGHHPQAMLAAEAAEAAAAQGKFWPMHDRLMQHTHHLQRADLHRDAQALGLDMPRFDAEMADHVYLQRVQEHLSSGRASQVRQAPCFFVDGHRVETANDLQALEQAIKVHLPPPTAN